MFKWIDVQIMYFNSVFLFLIFIWLYSIHWCCYSDGGRQRTAQNFKANNSTFQIFKNRNRFQVEQSYGGGKITELRKDSDMALIIFLEGQSYNAFVWTNRKYVWAKVFIAAIIFKRFHWQCVHTSNKQGTHIQECKIYNLIEKHHRSFSRVISFDPSGLTLVIHEYFDNYKHHIRGRIQLSVFCWIAIIR